MLEHQNAPSDIFRCPGFQLDTSSDKSGATCPRRLAGFDGAVGRLEADFAMGAIAEWPVRASSAATQGKSNPASQVVFVAVNIDDFDNTVGDVNP